MCSRSRIGGSSVLITSETANLAEIAGYYSQLAGVLAGFSFAALVAIVTVRRDGNASASFRSSLAPLASAFIALIASSLNYAVMSGEPVGSARLAVLQAISGMGFSVAGFMLVYSVLVLLGERRAGEDPAALVFLRRLTVYVFPPLLVLLMWGGLRDHLGLKYPGDDFVAADWVAVGALAVVVIACVAVGLTARDAAGERDRIVELLPGCGAYLAFFSLICSTALISLTPPDAVLPDVIPVIALLIGSAFCVFVAYSAARRHHVAEVGLESAATGREGGADDPGED